MPEGGGQEVTWQLSKKSPVPSIEGVPDVTREELGWMEGSAPRQDGPRKGWVRHLGYQLGSLFFTGK